MEQKFLTSRAASPTPPCSPSQMTTQKETPGGFTLEETTTGRGFNTAQQKPEYPEQVGRWADPKQAHGKGEGKPKSENREVGKGIWLKQFWCSTKTQKQEKEFTLGEDAEDTDPKVAFLHPAKGKDQSSEIQKSSPNPGRQSLIKSLILKLCNTPSTGNSLSQILLHSTRFKSLSSRSNVIRLFFFPLPSLTLICKNSCYCGRKLKSETSSTWSMSRLVRSTHLDLVKKDVTQSWRCRVVVLEVDLCFFYWQWQFFPQHMVCLARFCLEATYTQVLCFTSYTLV